MAPHRPQHVGLVDLEGRHLEADWKVPIHPTVYSDPTHSGTKLCVINQDVQIEQTPNQQYA
jgi:hypothetical protein